MRGGVAGLFRGYTPPADRLHLLQRNGIRREDIQFVGRKFRKTVSEFYSKNNKKTKNWLINFDSVPKFQTLPPIESIMDMTEWKTVTGKWANYKY